MEEEVLRLTFGAFIVAIGTLVIGSTELRQPDPASAATPEGYVAGVVRAVPRAETEVEVLDEEVLPDGTVSHPVHKLVLIDVNIGNIAAERARVLAEHKDVLDRMERTEGRIWRAGIDAQLSKPYDDAIKNLSDAGGSQMVASAGTYEWTGQCWVPVISRLSGVDLSRASWDAPCGSESDPVLAQWWMHVGDANTRTVLGGWESTGFCYFNPVQYLWLDTGAALGWFANTYSLAEGLAFPYSPACGYRAHARLWSVPTFAVGYLTFGTPHREQVNSGGHTVLSWNDGMNKLYSDYTSYPWGNGGYYYCGWVWAGTYGSGGSVSCGIELTWSP